MLAQAPQWIVTGLTLGAVYALVALGFVMIYAVTDVINLAQGEFLMLGALLAVSFKRLGWPMIVAAILAVAVTMAVGAATQLLALRPARHASALTLIIITIGISIALRGAALLLWGTDTYKLDPPFTRGRPFDLGPAVVVRQSLWIVGTLVVSSAALYAFFNHTLLGKGLRACAINPTAARLMGVRPGRMATLSFTLGAGLAALAGVVIAPYTFLDYNSGFSLGLRGFVAAIVGGLTSPAGAVGGGLLVGVLEAVGGGINAAYKDAVAFVILLIVLLARRFALFGAGEASGGGL